MKFSKKQLLPYLLGSILLILPFLHSSFLPNSYEFPKFLFFVIAVQALVIFFLVPKLFVKGIHFFSPNLLDILVFSFTAALLIADIGGIDPRISLLGSVYRHQGFVLSLSFFFFYALLRSLTKPEGNWLVRFFFKGIIISTFFLCLTPFVQALVYYLLPQSGIPTYQGRIVGTMGNPNFLGGYLAMILPFVLLANLKTMFHISKIQTFFLKRILILLIIAVILLSDSRSAQIAAGVVLLGSFVYVNIQSVLWQRIIMGILLTLSLVIFSNQELIMKRDSIWDNRSLIWSKGVEGLVKRPMLGYGQENFELVFPKERHMKVDNAHNIFLEIAVSSGIIGLGLFLTILVVVFKHAPLQIKLSLLAFLISAFFNPVSIAQIALFWFLLGISSLKNRFRIPIP